MKKGKNKSKTTYVVYTEPTYGINEDNKIVVIPRGRYISFDVSNVSELPNRLRKMIPNAYRIKLRQIATKTKEDLGFIAVVFKNNKSNMVMYYEKYSEAEI